MLRLKELRREKNLSQYQLSSSLGVSRSTIAMWESGATQPDNAMLISLSSFFGVSIDYLLGNDTHHSDINSDVLSARDKRDIAKDMESLRDKLKNREDGPISFDGENINDEDVELLLDAIEMMLKRVKRINKEKYNPNKHK